MGFAALSGCALLTFARQVLKVLHVCDHFFRCGFESAMNEYIRVSTDRQE